MGANILLAYFHYCNKGLYPFAAEIDEQELAKAANLDVKQIRFIEWTRSYLKDNGMPVTPTLSHRLTFELHRNSF